MTRANGQPTVEADERKERRRASNRRSARKSRYRENVFTLELQKTVSELSKKNEELRAENEAFRQEVVALQNLMLKTKTLRRDTGPDESKALSHFQSSHNAADLFHRHKMTMEHFLSSPSCVETVDFSLPRILPSVGGDNGQFDSRLFVNAVRPLFNAAMRVPTHVAEFA